MRTVQFDGRTRSLLKLSEAAQLFGVSSRSFWDLYATGAVRGIRVGRRSLRFPVDDLEAYLQKKGK